MIHALMIEGNLRVWAKLTEPISQNETDSTGLNPDTYTVSHDPTQYEAITSTALSDVLSVLVERKRGGINVTARWKIAPFSAPYYRVSLGTIYFNGGSAKLEIGLEAQPCADAQPQAAVGTLRTFNKVQLSIPEQGTAYVELKRETIHEVIRALKSCPQVIEYVDDPEAEREAERECIYCGKYPAAIREYHSLTGKKFRRRICKECFEQRFQRCHQCHKYHNPSAMTLIWSSDGNHHYSWCQKCVEKAGVVTCPECDKSYPKDQQEGFKEGICGRCWRDYGLDHCARCNKIIRLVEQYTAIGFPGVFCRDHHPKAPPKTLLEYNHKPLPIFGHDTKVDKLPLNQLLYLGVELEVDGGVFADELVQKIPKDAIYCKRDGSLGDLGIEIVSHPMTLEFHHKYKWDKILDMCREHNYKGSERCGLHVHINKTAFQRTTSIASLAGWVAKHRRAVSRYAGRHYEAQSVRHYARYTTEDGSTLASRVFNSGDRYQAVNSVNPKTVELRMFASTVDYGVLMARLEMAHAMASYTRDASVVKIMKDTWDDFMRFVEDRPREYPRLPSYMAEMDLPIEQDEDEEYF